MLNSYHYTNIALACHQYTIANIPIYLSLTRYFLILFILVIIIDIHSFKHHIKVQTNIKKIKTLTF